MALKSDAQGFLSGDPIDIGRAISVLEQIRSDVRAIRSAIKGSGGSPGAVAEKQATVTPEQRKSAPGVKRDSLIRPVATPAGRTRSPAIPKVNANSPAIPAGNSRSLAPSDANIVKALNQIGREIAKPSGRDAKGRFTPKIVDSKSPDALKKAKENNDKDKELKALASGRVGDIASAGVEKVAEVDPAVQAFQEIAQPLARGWEMISKGRGSKDKDAAAQTGLLRRVYATLTGFRSEAFITGKAANKSLKNLEDKPEGGAESGGILSMLSKIPFIGPMIVSAITALGAGLMSLLSKIPGFGFLKKVPVTGALGVGGVAGGLGGAAGEAGAAARGGLAGGAKSLGKGILRKLPIIGSLLSLGMGAADAATIEGDATISRDEKNAKQGKNIGGVAGGLGGAAAGAAIGTLIFPGVGTVIGGVIGAVAGDWLGGNAGEVIGENFKGITESMASGWASVTGTISAAWAGVTAGFMVVSDAIGINWTAIGEVFSSIGTGIGKAWDTSVSGFKAIGEGIGKAWGEFVDSAKSGWDSFTGLFSAAYEGLKKIPVIGSAIQAAEDAAKAAAEAAKALADKVVSAAKEKAAAVKDKAVEAVDKTVAVAKEAGAAAKTAYVEKVAPGTTTPGPAPVGVINKAAAAVGGAAGSVSNASERAYNVTASATGSTLENVLPKGYRHKALFDGIKGGDSLTKNGSYTDEEAAKIRELKTSGANTSANIKGGMSTEIQDKISAQSKKYGLDPVMMQKIAAMESGGNANAVSATGASGIYQFTGQTASGVGITNRFDADQNIEGGMKLTQQNSEVLKKAKLPVSAENLYMMHQLGPNAAKEVIKGAGEGKSKSDMSPETQKAMNLNYGAKSATAADYIATNKKALDDRYASSTSGGGQGTEIAKVGTPPVAKVAETKIAIAQAKKDDPSQGGRYNYKDIGDNQLSVTDKETGISELASEEQARAYRVSEGKAYKDQLAQANDPNSYKPGGALSNSPASTAATETKASRFETMDFDKSRPSPPSISATPSVSSEKTPAKPQIPSVFSSTFETIAAQLKPEMASLQDGIQKSIASPTINPESLSANVPDDLSLSSIFERIAGVIPKPEAAPKTQGGNPLSNSAQPSSSSPSLAIAPTAPVVVSAPSPAISVSPSSTPAPESPAMPEQMASIGGKKPASGATKSPDVGQDVKDRRIAHIVTGGFSAG